MNQTECNKYAFPNPEQKYCSGEPSLLQDTCQVRMLYKYYIFKIETNENTYKNLFIGRFRRRNVLPNV
jgi:hypothetical protein